MDELNFDKKLFWKYIFQLYFCVLSLYKNLRNGMLDELNMCGQALKLTFDAHYIKVDVTW